MSNGDKVGKAGMVVVGGLSLATLIAVLTRKAPSEEIPPTDEAIKLALAAILAQQLKTEGTLNDIYNAVKDVHNALLDIGKTLGVEPAPTFILDQFQKDNQTLHSGVPFSVYVKSPGKGALIWAIIDVSDPNCKLQVRIDDLLWEFEYTTLNAQGIDRPLFPGVWLSKYDAANKHYVMVFSPGTVAGFQYKVRLEITVTYTGTSPATAILNQGRGIALIEV